MVVEWVWGCQRRNITATTATSNSKTHQPIGNDTSRVFNTSKPKLAGTIPSINTTNKSLIHPFAFTSSTRYVTLSYHSFFFFFQFSLLIRSLYFRVFAVTATLASTFIPLPTTLHSTLQSPHQVINQFMSYMNHKLVLSITTTTTINFTNL